MDLDNSYCSITVTHVCNFVQQMQSHVEDLKAEMELMRQQVRMFYSSFVNCVRMLCNFSCRL